VIMHTGATPVIVDTNPDDFNICITEVEKAITSKTKAIIPVDFAGFPVDIDQINELAVKYKHLFVPKGEKQETLGRMLVLSDSAHSFGAEYKNKKTGSLTDVSVFSFHAVKNLTTAEGGSIALNLPMPFDNDKIYYDLNAFSLHGQSKDALAKTQKGAWRYDILNFGYKGNMTDIQSSLGLWSLHFYDSQTLPKRKYIFDKYFEAFKDSEHLQLPIAEDNFRKTCYHLFPLRIKNISETQRDEIIAEIFEHEVSVNVHFQPVPMFSAYKNAGFKVEDFPVSYDNYSREITLPVYELLTDENIITVINAVKNSIKKVLGK